MKNSSVITGKPEALATFGKSKERNTARYVSDTIVYEEALESTRLIGLYYSATGQVQRENVTESLPGLHPLTHPLHVFELEIDGQSLHNRWDWVNAYDRASARPGTLEAVIELKHQVRPISVRVVTRMDGSPVIVRYLEITNTGDSPAALSHVAPLSGVIWNTNRGVWGSNGTWNPSVDAAELESKFSLGYMPAEEWGMEGDFTWTALPRERFRIERSAGRSHGSPYFILKNEITGELAFIGIAWSGNFYAEFNHHFEKLLSFRVGPLGPAPLRVIAPSETVTSPEVHLGLMHSDMDAAVSSWHRHIRASVVPPRPEGKEMYTVGGRVVEQPGEWILREVDIAAEMGLEAFMVDAGWYGETFGGWPELRGDWVEGDWLPGKMAGVREYVHKKGMLFGLWMEPEAVTSKSRLYAEHPDWVLETDNGRKLDGLILNLANREAAKYVEDSIISVIRDFRLDFQKIDFNIATLEGGQSLRDGYAEHEGWRHFETLYGVYDRVRRELPNVALENCAGGGGRNDLGMLSRFHYCCESDMSAFPLSIRTINAMTMFLPPEAMCYYHNHIEYAHHTADLDTHLRVTLFATPIFVGFGAQDADRSKPYFAKCRKYIELAKTFCRPILANRCSVYHHTPDIGVFRPADWCVLEYAADDRSRGYAGLFRLSGAGSDEYTFRPRGLDLAREYEVTLDNSAQKVRLSGWELANQGINVRLDTPLTSQLLMFEAVEG